MKVSAPQPSINRALGAALRNVGLGAALLVGFGCALGSDRDEDVSVSQVPGRRGESTAERLHRHGVNCMDQLERSECAIDYFEQLVALDAPERELMGDAIFRLVKLYKRADRDEDVKRLMRRYWELGMARGSSTTVPYAARFLPADMTVMVTVNMERLGESKLWQSIDPEIHDLIFTCDEALREELKAKRKARREAAKARGDAPSFDPTRSPSDDDDAKDDAKDKGEDGKPGQSGSEAPRPDPVFEDLCKIAEALGQPDPRAWSRFTSAVDHWDPTNSMLILEIDELGPLLDAGVAEGRLVAAGERRFTVPALVYQDAPVELVKLDSDEIVVTPAKLAPDLLAAFDNRDERLHADLVELIESTPDDVVFFTAMTRPALVWGIKQAGNFAASVMPQPRGMVISAAAYEYAGVFVRMHTPDQLKSAFLIRLVRLFMTRAAESAAEDGPSPEAELLSDMDLSQASDGSIIFSSVLSTQQVNLFLGMM